MDVLNLGKFRELTKNLPNSTKIYIEADHGQMAEVARDVTYTVDNTKGVFYGNKLNWSSKTDTNKTTGILVSGI